MDVQEQQQRTKNDTPDKVAEKWGAAVLGGYQAVPHALFRYQAQLDLSNGELVTLLNILDFWWEAKNAPFPGATILAKRMDIDPRTVQRHLKSLQDKGYAVRERGTDEKRRFRLDGLVNRLSKLVRQELGLDDASSRSSAQEYSELLKG